MAVFEAAIFLPMRNVGLPTHVRYAVRTISTKLCGFRRYPPIRQAHGNSGGPVRFLCGFIRQPTGTD